MNVPIAYFGVILIWSTTPLAIAWSVEAAGFVFGISSRMLLGTLLAFIFSLVMSTKIVWHRQALLAYIYVGLGIYGGMMAVYWSAQFIPSGWISLLFGFTPIFTAMMASFWLNQELLTKPRSIGMLIGLLGLILIFGSSLALDSAGMLGVLGVLCSGLIHSASAIWIKRVNAHVPAISMTVGSLLVATPLFLFSWLSTAPDFDTTWQSLMQAPNYTWIAILYLALFGSVFGFSLYYYVLKHVEATKVALISLVTPVTSLLLGHLFNNEALTLNIMLGAALIIAGLAVFELGGKPLPKWVPFRPN